VQCATTAVGRVEKHTRCRRKSRAAVLLHARQCEAVGLMRRAGCLSYKGRGSQDWNICCCKRPTECVRVHWGKA
jgi:hypothetical protein